MMGQFCADNETIAILHPGDALLVLQRPVPGHEHFKASFFRHFEQFAVFQATPTRMRDCCHFMVRYTSS
jgi:hypothetical protein